MANEKKTRQPYKHGREIRVKLSRQGIARRNEIKMLIASLTGRAYGKITDNAVFEKALDMYYEAFVVEKTNILPDGFELLDDEDALTNDPP